MDVDNEPGRTDENRAAPEITFPYQKLEQENLNESHDPRLALRVAHQ
jgi:hypothetical protein